MATFQVNGPDGSAYNVTAPDGASPDAVMAYVKANAGKGNNPAIRPVTQQQQGVDRGAVAAAGHSLADTFTLGLADPAMAAIGTGLNNLAGGNHTYSQTLGEIKADARATEEAHPYASLGGGAAGLVGGGGALAKAIPEALTMGGREVLGIKNILRAAGINGVIGGTVGAVQGGAETGTANGATTGGAAGFLTGAALGPATEAIAPSLSSAGMKATRLFAKIIGETPDVVQQAIDNFRLGTSPTGNPAHGRTPLMAELLSLKQQGAIRDLARGYPELGTHLAEAAAAQPETMQRSMGAVIGKPLDGISAPAAASQALQDSYTRLPVDGTPEAMENWVKTEGDKQFATLHGQSVQIDPNEAQQLQDVLANTTIGRASQGKMLESIQNGTLDLDHAGALRQKLTASARAHPEGPFYEDRQFLDDLLSRKSPEYAQAVSDYSHRAQLAEGAALGYKLGGSEPIRLSAGIEAARPGEQAGVPIGARASLLSDAYDPKSVHTLAETQATDIRQQHATETALGPQAQGNIARVAQTESAARQSLRGAAPPSVGAAEDNSQQQAVHAVASMAYHNPVTVAYHVSHFFKGLRMSPQTADIVGRYLTDPHMTNQAVNILRKAGASNGDIIRFANGISATAGSKAGRGVVEGQ